MVKNIFDYEVQNPWSAFYILKSTYFDCFLHSNYCFFSGGWDRFFLKVCQGLTNPRRRQLWLGWSLSDKEGLWFGQLWTSRGSIEASLCTTPDGASMCHVSVHQFLHEEKPAINSELAKPCLVTKAYIPVLGSKTWLHIFRDLLWTEHGNVSFSNQTWLC